jgi:uncharacterized integral membrane protein
MTTKRIRLIVAFGLAALLITWILQNAGPVETKLLFFTVTMPQNALLAITALLGMGTGILLALRQTESGKKKDK